MALLPPQALTTVKNFGGNIFDNISQTQAEGPEDPHFTKGKTRTLKQLASLRPVQILSLNLDQGMLC